MVDVKELLQGGEFLNVAFVQDRNVLERSFTVLNEGEIKEKTFEGKTTDKLELLIEFTHDKIKKLWTPNAESMRAFITGSGSRDSKDWVSCVGNFSVVKGKNKIEMLVSEFLQKAPAKVEVPK